ncbi:MAG: glycosyltransferase family 2 protein [Patescibacteria group bacterium]
MISISAVVLTKNSEKTLDPCLKSISFANEIVVVDDFSQDKTIEIAKKHKAKIYKRKLNGDFAGQRNFALQHTHEQWVLFLDSDEEFIGGKPDLSDDYSGYYINRKDIFLDMEIKHGEAGRVKLIRIARKDAGKWKRKVHEYWDIGGKIGTLKNKILHNSHPIVKDFISKVNFYAIIHASENQKEGKRSNLLKILFFPLFKFLDSFLIKGGFFDGIHGFVYAAIMSFHSFLVWSVIWIKQK